MNDTVKTDLVAYYATRADEYENIYAKPERQADLANMREHIRTLLRNQRVLELACGTGYWTAQFADAAAFVHAIDINQHMLDVARSKNLPADKVEFALADAYHLPPQQGFTACFAGFWWSHVKREDQAAFLQRLRETMGKDTLLVLIDNTYVEGSNTPVARTDAEGNTYQIRKLGNGERYEVLKNFPTDSALRKKLASAVKDIRIVRTEYFWLLSGRLK